MPIPPQPQGNPLMSNPQLFAQMLQQQGYAPQANMAGGPPPQGGGMPPQQPQGGPPPGSMQPQAGQAPGMRPPMPGAAGPAQGPQGIPPQMLQALMAQRQQQQGGGQQQGAPQQGQPQIPPQLQQMLMQHMMQQHMMQQQQNGGQRPPQGQNMHTPQELAALGRMGDTTVAHLTPGEVEVPPQVQTPKVLATIDKAFKSKGVDPQKFVAGSPKSSVNPQTGMPEYNFWSSFLPMALGVGGGLIGGPLGAAAGDALGGVATGNSLGSSLMGGALTGLGDWGAGALVGGLGGSGSGASDAANTMGANGLGSSGAAPTVDSAASQMPQTIGASGVGSGGIGAQSLNAGIGSSTQLPVGAAAAQPQSMMNSMFNNPGANISALANGQMPSNVNYGNLAGAGAGAGLAAMLMPPSTTNANSALTSPFTQPYKNASQLPSWQSQVGTANYQGATPSFANYNPATNFPTAYNFYSAANGQPQTTTPAASG